MDRHIDRGRTNQIRERFDRFWRATEFKPNRSIRFGYIPESLSSRDLTQIL